MVSGYSTSTIFSQDKGWSTDSQVLGRHKESIESLGQQSNNVEIMEVLKVMRQEM